MKIIVFLLILTLVFACSKDENQEEQGQNLNIIGKWQLQKSSKPLDHEECDYDGWLNIRSDRTYQEYDKCLDQTLGGKWKIVSENNLQVISDIYPVPMNFLIETANDSILVLTYSGDKMTYKKFK